MNTTGWSEQQLEGYRQVKTSLAAGIGYLAIEGGLIAAEATDTFQTPRLGHALFILLGAGLVGSNLLYLRDMRKNPPQPLDGIEQI